MFDFGALPPEINSARMYAGAGAGPMMAAASAWHSLAAELGSTASAYESVISTLAGDEWLGPSSAAMAAAAAPYVGWMNTTAAAAQHAASQAMASAAAYETAFAMTVPPPVIAANRAQLAALVATNFLGINTPAIMATEAHYSEMWAQDAAAMYGYAGSSRAAGVLQPLTPPTPTTNPGGITAQAAAVGAAGTGGAQTQLSQLISALPNTVGSLASPSAASSGLSAGSFAAYNINAASGISSWMVMNAIPTAISAQHVLSNPPFAAAAAADTPLAGGLGGGMVLANAVGPAGTGGMAGFGGAPVSAGLGQASSVGGMSVPSTWSAATPAGTGPAMPAGTGWATEAESTPVEAMPAGMPAAASAGRATGFSTPRYGFKPTVMPKQVLV